MATFQPLADDAWLAPFPLSAIGMEIGRNVTVLRLASGKLLIHSTAPFSPGDVDSIASLGTPGWILDASNFHDTFADEASSSFPDLPYLVPGGFPAAGRVETCPLAPPPGEWDGEIDVIALGGMPKVREHVLLHRASKTLVVCDLVFHLPRNVDAWTRTGFRTLTGIRSYPGNSRLFRMMIRDRDAFEDSLREVLDLDFDRVVPGHGVPFGDGAKDRVREAMRTAGFGV